MRVDRRTVDLSEYPDLVVIYLGMKVRGLRGLKTLIGLGPGIQKAVAAKPDGLLRHEDFFWGLWPVHAGMRQYWRDFESLERWARSEPHRQWWTQFLKDSGSTGFWHETYFRRGGFEAIYDDLHVGLGLSAFAPTEVARGAMFGARRRAGVAGDPAVAEPLTEQELYAAAR